LFPYTTLFRSSARSARVGPNVASRVVPVAASLLLPPGKCFQGLPRASAFVTVTISSTLEKTEQGSCHGRLVERDRRPGAALPGAQRRDGAGGDRPAVGSLGRRGGLRAVAAGPGRQAAHHARRTAAARGPASALALSAAPGATLVRPWYTP